ncbi:MAG: AsmA family protein [Alphaproteobacteria bacterium]|nr:AsmA family protein [Alphaproteobacteria bacterium]
MRKNKPNIFFRIFRRFAISFRLLILTLMAAVASLGIYIYTTDPNLYKDRIISEIHKSSGVSVDKWGHVSWDISPRPVISFEDVYVSFEGNAASLKRMSVRINLISLLRERVSIEQIAINNLKLEISEDMKPGSRGPVIEGGGERLIQNIPARELILRNPVIKFGGETYAPQLLRLVIDRKSSSDSLQLRIISGGDVYDIRATVAPLNAERRVYPIRATALGRGLDLTADLALERTSLVPIDFKLRGTVVDTSNILGKLGLEIPKIMPVNIIANGGFGHHDVTFRRLEIKSALPRGGSGLTAVGELNWGRARPYAKLDLKSDRLVLGEIFPTLYNKPVPWQRPTDRPLNVFKDSPMPVGILQAWDGWFKLDVKSLVVYRELNISGIKAEGLLKNHEFAVLGSTTTWGGKSETSLHGIIEDGKIYAAAEGRGERVQVAQLLAELRNPDLISRLPANFQFVARAEGGDLTGLMSTATGRLQARSSGRGFAHKDLVSHIYGKDFLTSLGGDVRDLFRSNRDEDQVKIDCAAVNLKVRNGLAETRHGIAVETSVFNINVAGDIDLGRETLRVNMTSRPVSGLRLSVTGDLISLMEFSGNLAEPSITLNSSGVLKKTAHMGVGAVAGLALAPFTGGASLAIGAAGGWIGGNLISSWLADNNPCRTAFDASSAPVKRNDPRFMRIPLADAMQEIRDEANKRLAGN